MEVNNLFATIVSVPWVEYESPMTLVFEARIKNDVVPVKFIGDRARVLKNFLRKGDVVVITVGFFKNGWLATEHCVLESNTAVGRQVNYYA